MNGGLREQLEQVADRAPQVRVPSDTWARGRRARRRGLLLDAVLVLALVASLAGLGWLAPRPDVPPAGEPEGRGAVPDRFWPAPSRLVTPDGAGVLRWDDSVAEHDLAVGAASAVVVPDRGGGLPLVVTATDGVHHPLRLPGYALAHQAASLMSEGSTRGVALSPDGRQLAWAYGLPARGRTDDGPVPCGIRIADLRTGEVREVDLRPALEPTAQAVVADVLVWSPDGRWLAWAGRQYGQYNGSGQGSGDVRRIPLAGRIAPGSSTSEPLPAAMTDLVAVDDAGVVTSLRGAELLRRGGGPTTRRAVELPRSLRASPRQPGAASPSGRYVALGSPTPSDAVHVLDTRTGRVLARRVLPELAPQTSRPLGWIDEDLMVAQVRPAGNVDAAGWTTDETHVVVLSAPTVPRARWTYRVVGRNVPADGGRWSPVSVAVDLMSLERPTRSFPQPDWPWSPGRKVVAALLAALAVLLAAAVVRRLRRR